MEDNKKSKKPSLTDIEKLLKRREYMRKYYQRKKMERIKSGKVVNPSRPVSKKPNQFFTIKRGEFIVRFD